LQKNFLNVYNPKSPQRIQNLLESVNLPERSIKSVSEIDRLHPIIDYSQVTIKLDELRNKSIDYLLNAIEE